MAHFMGDYMYDYSVAYKGELFGDALPQEAFAHMFAATIQNPEALANIKAYFPKSYRVFEEMVSDYVKGATP